MGPSPFAPLLGIADRVVVVDTETTGFTASDRVVEIACVTVDLHGRVIGEWQTLLDPGRDVGPTEVHGITAAMVAGAPTFADVVDDLARQLHGAVLAAHNLPFDARMLAREIERLADDRVADFGVGLDTLRATRAKLGVSCAEYGISLDGAHRALDDARATAELLVRVAGQLPTHRARPVALECRARRTGPGPVLVRPG